MNRLSTDRRAQVVAALVEGNSIRATVRMTGVAKNTVVKLLADLGQACSNYQDRTLRELPCTFIECDEIWSYCYAKQKNVPEEHKDTFGYGDVWTWTAIDGDTKLMVTWLVGERSLEDARTFADDLASRVVGRPQITTDALSHYREVIPAAFHGDVDFAQVRKSYATGAMNVQGRRVEPAPAHIRYSPGRCTGMDVYVRTGDPQPERISTSYVERQNLTMRMGMRRFTRLTNAFSKKIENLTAAVSLHFMHYNFCRVHQTLKQTPAMAAGLTDHVWTIEQMCELLQTRASN